jgi:hypothetical protein
MPTSSQPQHRRPPLRPSRLRGLSLRGALLVAMSLAMALFGGLLTQSSASATTGAKAGQTQYTEITIDLPALVVDNLCNTDVVNLHGQMTIRTATTPTSNGAMRVVSTASARNLTGTRIAPLPQGAYKGDQVDNTYSYIAPPPYPTTYTLLHWLKLVPQFKAPAMWLVVVTREVINADGTTVPVVDRAYLVCTQPSSHDCHHSK